MSVDTFYREFLANKRVEVVPSGFDLPLEAINPKGFLFQRDVVRWALKLGKAAIFANVGLGKTFMQLEFAKHVTQHIPRPALILAPLAVAPQTIKEGKKFDIDVAAVQDQAEMDRYLLTSDTRIFITNYDRAHLFDFEELGCIVLDESSILKHYTKTFFSLVERCANIPYKLCCTATPAPNDFVELGNHAMFLDVMHFKDMLARWFVGEGDIAREARLKHHARADFWRWLTSWAVCISKPSDLGDQYAMSGYDLPPMHPHEYRLSASQQSIDRAWEKGILLPGEAVSATGFMQVKRDSLDERIEQAVKIVESIWGISLWHGSQNTQNEGEKNTSLILKNEPDDNHKDDLQKKTKSTWQTTTGNTLKNGKKVAKKIKKSATPDGEGATPATQSSEQNVAPRLENETKPQNETEDSNPISASTALPTTPYLSHKTDDVQSAALNLETGQNDDSTSIMITLLEPSGDSYVHPVTSDLENSETTPISSRELSNTSLNTKHLDPILIWCDTDFEQRALEAAFGDYAISVYGSLSPKLKESRLNGWLDGERPILITKPEIAGFGLNCQFCNQMIFTGSSFSFERPYQAIGRIRRFGQRRDVHIHWIYSETEGNVMEILRSKEAQFAEMQAEMNAAMREYGLFREHSNKTVYVESQSDVIEGKNWVSILGDCIEQMANFKADSIDLTVTSIPFSNLYIYSDSAADVGNAQDKNEFFEHMAFVIRELLRVTVPGRCCAVHVKDLPLFQNRDGVMGIDPFSDDVTAAFRSAGWVLQSRITVEKDPVIEMQKTNSHGLLFKNWKERAEILRVGLPDYVLIFQKPGDSKRVTHDPSDITYYGEKPPAGYRFLNAPMRGSGVINTALPIWQEYANPNWKDVVVPLVWTDIDQTDVLNYLIAKSDKDERHICPLQLDLIARLIQWKSNPGDVVLDPFGGVASTGVKALEMKRKAVVIELKEGYRRLGLKYLKQAEIQASAPTLFDLLDEHEAAQKELEVQA